MDAALAQVSDKRLQKMHELYLAGATLEEIGNRFGVSRQRVQQIFQEAGLSTRSVGETASLRRVHLLLEKEEEIAMALAESSDVRAVARDLKVPQVVVREVLRRHFPDGLPRRQQRSRSAIYSNRQLLGCLKQASAAVGGGLSVAAYRDHAAGRRLRDGHAWPSVHTYVSRFGSWGQALEAADLPFTSSARSARRRFSVDDCLQALRSVSEALGGPPTMDAYTAFVRSSTGHSLPSAMTIRNRLGSWSEALSRAGL